MDFIKELLAEAKREKVVSKDAAHDVYHRDYLRTRNKKYRKYNKNKEHHNDATTK